MRIDHENSDSNIVQNNIFGLKPNGLGKLPNMQSGIDVQWGASRNLIGGLGANEGNVFSAHPYAGVDLSHSTSTSFNEVVGNFIGTNLTGDAVTSYTRTYYGITIKDDVANNFVHDNVIGGADAYPIWHKHSYTGGNTISNNLIGVARNGTALRTPRYGMYMQGHDFTIRDNVFANSAQGGIFLEFAESDRNEFSGNTFMNNGGLAIDLAPAGPTANDAGDGDTGPNENLNYPVLTAASTTAVAGTACAGCRVEVYRSTVDTGNRGEGNKFVGSATAAANGSFSAAVSGVVGGDNVAAIAIDPSKNTSEFSPVISVGGTPPPPPPPPPPPGNLLLNSGFEVDANGDTRPDSWTIDPSSAAAVFSRSAEQVHGGSYSGRVRGNDERQRDRQAGRDGDRWQHLHGRRFRARSSHVGHVLAPGAGAVARERGDDRYANRRNRVRTDGRLGPDQHDRDGARRRDQRVVDAQRQQPREHVLRGRLHVRLIVSLEWEQVVIDARDPRRWDAGGAKRSGGSSCNDDADEVEIRAAPDRLPGILFGVSDDAKPVKNRLHLDFRPGRS